MIPHIDSSRKYPNLKFQSKVYIEQILLSLRHKSQNHKLNHCNLENICASQVRIISSSVNSLSHQPITSLMYLMLSTWEETEGLLHAEAGPHCFSRVFSLTLDFLGTSLFLFAAWFPLSSTIQKLLSSSSHSESHTD